MNLLKLPTCAKSQTAMSLVDKFKKLQSHSVDKTGILQCLAVLPFFALIGCATPAHVEVQQIKVPVPIACQESIPQRPVMPTEKLPQGAGLDQFVQAAQAEIERREGYEGQLRTALGVCTRPAGDL